MAKNLDVARYRNGDIIPQVTDASEWANLTTGAWCWYNNDSATYGSVYGRLYNWYAVNDPRGLAPEGWHVPSDGEWNKLVKCLDENTDTSCLGCQQSLIVGGLLKEIGTTHWESPNTGATNNFNFNSLPGGFILPNGVFSYVGFRGYYWSSTGTSSGAALSHDLYYNSSSIGRGIAVQNHGFYIRCIKDTPITTLNDGLVAYYPFNGNANDESGNGNNGTVNGASLTTDRFGNSGKAYSFDGYQSISSPHNSTLNIIGDLTLSAWFSSQGPPSFRTNHMIITKRSQSEFNNIPYAMCINYQYGIPSDYKKPMFVSASSYPNGYQYLQSVQDITNGNWNHIVSVINGNNLKIYLNGNVVLDTLVDNSKRVSNNSNLLIGSGARNDLPAEQFVGSLDDIRIYNRALTQEEITYLATH